MTEEKRKYLRFEVIVPVELVEIDGFSGEEAQAVLDNISREGMRLILDMENPIGLGTELNFKINSAEQCKSCIITGEVVWSKSTGDKMEIGLKIKAIERGAKAELLDMAYNRWKDEQSHPKKPS
jgi:hypothetical protein